MKNEKTTILRAVLVLESGREFEIERVAVDRLPAETAVQEMKARVVDATRNGAWVHAADCPTRAYWVRPERIRTAFVESVDGL